MNKQETLRFLTDRGIRYELTEHPAVFNMAELALADLPYPDRIAKNLFVRDDKKRNYSLITVRGDKRVDLKAFRKAHGLRPLTFASGEELRDLLGLTPGEVTPLGILNCSSGNVTVYLDRAFLGGVMGVHPNDNTATVWLQAEDLIRLALERGVRVCTAAFGPEPSSGEAAE